MVVLVISGVSPIFLFIGGDRDWILGIGVRGFLAVGILVRVLCGGALWNWGLEVFRNRVFWGWCLGGGWGVSS